MLKAAQGKVEIDTERGWLKHRSKHHELTERTVHLLQVVQDSCGKGFVFCEKVIEQVKNHFEVIGGPVDLPPN